MGGSERGWWDAEVGRAAARVARADPRAPGGLLPDLEDLEAAVAAVRGRGHPAGSSSPPRPPAAGPRALPADLRRLALSKEPWHRAVAWRLLRLLSSGARPGALESLDADPLARGFWARACDGAGGAPEQFEALALCRAWATGRARELPAAVAAGLVATAGDSGARAFWQVLQLLRLLAERSPAQLTRHRGLEPLMLAACGDVAPRKGDLPSAQAVQLANACARAVGAALADPRAFEQAEGDGWSALAPVLAPLMEAAAAHSPPGGAPSAGGAGGGHAGEGGVGGDGGQGAAPVGGWGADEALGSCCLGLGRVVRTWGGLFALLSSGGSRPSALGCLTWAYRTTGRRDVSRRLLLLFFHFIGVPAPHSLEAASRDDPADPAETAPFSGAALPADASGALFRALLLHGFVEAGGAEALLLAVERGPDPESAAELLANVVYLSEVLLPASWASRLHELAPSFAGRGASRLVQDSVRRVMQRHLESGSFFNGEAASGGSRAVPAFEGFGLGGDGVLPGDGSLLPIGLTSSTLLAGEEEGGALTLAASDIRGLVTGAHKASGLAAKTVWSRAEMDYMMLATGVTCKRSCEWGAWDWVAVLRWVKGPLAAGEGWHVSLSSKFIKRVCAFFCKRLSTVPRNHPSADLIVESGHGLLRSLLATEAGQACLSGAGSGNSKCRLLKFGIRALHLEAARERSLRKRIFHPLVLQKTLGGELLGMLTSAMNSPAGEAVLRKHGFHETIESIFQLEARSDLHSIIIHSIDFKHPRAPRRFLEIVGQLPNAESRFVGLSVGRQIIEALPWLAAGLQPGTYRLQTNPMHEGDQDAAHTATPDASAVAASAAGAGAEPAQPLLEHSWSVATWITSLLLRRALVSAGEERDVAVALLGALHRKGYGDSVVAVKPDVAALAEEPATQPVLLRMLASRGGQKYLQGSEWLGHELVQWSQGGPKSDDFGRRVERYFAEVQGLALPGYGDPASAGRAPPPIPSCSSEEARVLATDCLRTCLPMHLCGALASSPAGAATVASRYLDALLQSLRELKFPVRERVAAAVSLGQLAGAGDHGFALAKNSGGLRDLLALTRSAGHFELRAACMLAVSLCAWHPSARAFLLQAGWHTRTVRQSDLCRYALCLPEGIYPGAHSVPGAPAAKPGLGMGHSPTSAPAWDSGKAEAAKDAATASLEALAAMSNPVPSAQKAARDSLRDLRRKHPSLFKQESFFLSAVAILESSALRSASARRFVWDLFNEGLHGVDSVDEGVGEGGASSGPES